jgi:hypothetical protein
MGSTNSTSTTSASNNNSGDSKPRYKAEYTHDGDDVTHTEVDVKAAVNGNANGTAQQ